MSTVYGVAMIALLAGAALAVVAKRFGALVSVTGCALLAAVGLAAALGGRTYTLEVGSWLGFGHSALRADGVAGLFLALTGITGAGVSLAYAELPPSRLLATLHGTTLALIAVAIGADNAFLFFLAWEGLTVCIYLIASADRRRPGSLTEGYLTAGLTKLGGAALLAAFALLYARTGTFALASWLSAAPHLGTVTRSVLFVLFVITFATKVGILPLQGALPVGYGAAPRAGAATLSVALVAGFYGLWRFVVVLLAPAATWWGDALLVLGSLTALAGIVYAITQDDVRRFLGFSTVEHTGIVLLGLGVALLGQADHNRTLTAAGLLAASLHVAAHALAKTLALICVDRVTLATGRRTLDGLGGLMGRVRPSSRAMLLSTLTLAAMPPLGGFVSEWFTFQSLLQGFRMSTLLARLLCALGAAALALTGGLGVLAFAKLYGFMFLGTPRRNVAEVAEPSRVWVSLISLGVVVLGLGAIAPWEIHLLGSGLQGPLGFNPAAQVITHPLVLGPVFAKFSVLAPTWLSLALPALALCAVGLARGSTRRRARREAVWVSGTAAELARVQYQASAYSNPIRYVLRGPLGYTRELRDAEPSEGAGKALVLETRVVLAVDRYIYRPAAALALAAAARMRRSQSGRLSDYLLYMLAVLIAVLVLIPILR